jgi:hypothetical protein
VSGLVVCLALACFALSFAALGAGDVATWGWCMAMAGALAGWVYYGGIEERGV